MHNKTGTKHKPLQNNGGNNKQWTNNRTTTLEWSAEVTQGFYSFDCQTFALVLHSAVVKTDKMLNSCDGFLTYPMYCQVITINLFINILRWNKESGSQLTDSQG